MAEADSALFGKSDGGALPGENHHCPRCGYWYSDYMWDGDVCKFCCDDLGHEAQPVGSSQTLELREQHYRMLAIAHVKGQVSSANVSLVSGINLTAVNQLIGEGLLHKKRTHFILTDTGKQMCENASGDLLEAINKQRDVHREVGSTKPKAKSKRELQVEMVRAIYAALEWDLGNIDYSGPISRVAKTLLKRNAKSEDVDLYVRWLRQVYKQKNYQFEPTSLQKEQNWNDFTKWQKAQPVLEQPKEPVPVVPDSVKVTPEERATMDWIENLDGDELEAAYNRIMEEEAKNADK
jgi:hypothetical protein